LRGKKYSFRISTRQKYAVTSEKGRDQGGTKNHSKRQRRGGTTVTRGKGKKKQEKKRGDTGKKRLGARKNRGRRSRGGEFLLTGGVEEQWRGEEKKPGQYLRQKVEKKAIEKKDQDRMGRGKKLDARKESRTPERLLRRSDTRRKNLDQDERKKRKKGA